MSFSSFKPVYALAAIATVGTVVGSVVAPAHAVTFTGTTPGTISAVSGATTIDFGTTPGTTTGPINPSFTSGIATYTGGALVTDPNVGGKYARPVGSTGNYLTVGPSNDDFQPGPVEINFSTALNYFGLLWGSVDAYNTIAFFNGASLIEDFTGDQILAGANGNQGADGTVFANFSATGNNYFNRIVLSSSNFAFESDNHAYQAIPTPALLPGLVGFGIAALRKRKAQAEVAESEA